MAVGAEPWLERRRLILQPIQPSPAHGSIRHHPYLALAHSSPHDSYTGCGPIQAAAEQQPSLPDGGQGADLGRQAWPASLVGRWSAKISVAAAS